MKILKHDLQERLNLIKPGLSSRESLEQSSCFVFYNGEIITFNDEIACVIRQPILDGQVKAKGIETKRTDLVGAVTAKLLLGILDKIKDEKLEIVEDTNGELKFTGLLKGFKLNRDAEVLLPVEKIKDEKPRKEDWMPLPDGFQDVIDKVTTCVCQNEEFFALTCVHFHPKWVEACDSRQMLRWKINLGVEKSLLVRGVALSQISGLGMTHMAITESWVHFRNKNKGLVFSCRKFLEEYPDLSEPLQVQGAEIKLPPSLKEVAERAALFASEQVAGMNPMLSVKLRPKWVTVEGEGLSGSYYEHTKVTGYTGPKIQFIISPVLLKHISNSYAEAQITDSKLRASGGKWDYVSVLGKPKSRAEREAEHAAAEAAKDVDSESEEAPKKKKKKDEEVPF